MKDVVEELERWQKENRPLNIWWRDDDATSPNQELMCAVDVASSLSIPLSIAVIPASVDSSLPKYLATVPQVRVLQHGYTHTNFEEPQHPKSEFGTSRKLEDVLSDIARGYQILSDSFGNMFLPVFVPPWNRISDDFIPHLAQLGIQQLSVFGSGRHEIKSSIMKFNVHCDLIEWSNRESLSSNQIDKLISDELRARRVGSIDTDEPVGLLTHHLLHSQDFWSEFSSLIDLTLHYPCVNWIRPSSPNSDGESLLGH